MKEFYHIIDREKWQEVQAAGTYRPESVDSEGFIHCSYASQVLMPANALYQGRQNLVLLRIDPSKVTSEVHYDDVEVTRSGVASYEAFPHIYGPLNPDAVVEVIDFPPEPDGRFTLPEKLLGC